MPAHSDPAPAGGRRVPGPRQGLPALEMELLFDELDRCLRCGFCMAVCPTYGATGQEQFVARGRLNLIQQQFHPLPVVEAARAAPAAATAGEDACSPAGQVAGNHPPRKVAHGVDRPPTARRLEIGRKQFKEVIFSCLSCLACETACPPGVPITRLITAARADYVSRYGIPLIKRVAIQGALAHPFLLREGAHLASWVQGALFRDRSPGVPDGMGVQQPRCSLPLVGRRVFPRAARYSLYRRLEQIPRPPKARRRVAFFPGCMISAAYTDVGVALASMLARRGVEMIAPRQWQCCGMPAQVHGAWATARRQVLKNLEIMESVLDQGAEAILTACASCGSQLSHHMLELFEVSAAGRTTGGQDEQHHTAAADRSIITRLRRVAGRVMDATVYLADVLHYEPGPFALARPVTVTYHDPCHLARGQGVRQEPRQLLERVPGARFVEMEEADRCCGGAGIYFLEHPDLSDAIQRRKTQAIAATGADLVATACPACMMQLEDGLVRSGAGEGVHAVHVLQLLDDTDRPPAEQRRYRPTSEPVKEQREQGSQEEAMERAKQVAAIRGNAEKTTRGQLRSLARPVLRYNTRVSR